MANFEHIAGPLLGLFMGATGADDPAKFDMTPEEFGCARAAVEEFGYAAHASRDEIYNGQNVGTVHRIEAEADGIKATLTIPKVELPSAPIRLNEHYNQPYALVTGAGDSGGSLGSEVADKYESCLAKPGPTR